MVLVRPESSQNANGHNEIAQSAVRVKEPKRILHFSDGILEEYSSDEEDNINQKEQNVVDPATLSWGPWFKYKAWAAGSTTLSAMDKTGEFLASAFGITTPRYYFELEEHKRREGDRLKQEEHEKSWGSDKQNSSTIVLKPLSSDKVEPVQV